MQHLVTTVLAPPMHGSQTAHKLEVIGGFADSRAERQNRKAWLQDRLAGLTHNLPEQLQGLMLTGPCEGATAHGPVTRRDLMELMPGATVRLVPAASPQSHEHVATSNSTENFAI